MNSLIILPQEDTPSVVLDKSAGIFEITGVSFPENPNEFYGQVISWIEAYTQNPNIVTDFVFKLKYFNTASAKRLIKILQILDKLFISNKVKVLWYYIPQDKEILEFAQRFQEVSSLPIEFIQEK